MKHADSPGRCAVCGGEKRPDVTLFAVDLGTGVLVVRDVPALICSQCGQTWFSNDTMLRLETLANDARARGAEIEVITMPSAA